MPSLIGLIPDFGLLVLKQLVDAFTCDWADDNNLWIPPIHLIPRVIRHAQRTNSQGTLIVPKWVSSPFWLLLFPNGVDPAEFVMAWTELPQHDWFILPGRSGSSLFNGTPNSGPCLKPKI